MPKRNRRPTRAQRQYQRDFIAWLAEHKDEFDGRAVRTHVTMRYVRLFIEELNPAIRIKILDDNVWVSFHDERGHWVDAPINVDMAPRRKGSGYVCAFCDPEHQEVFPDISAMRTGHLYKSMLETFKEHLFPARCLEVLLGKGFFSAHLLAAPLPEDRISPSEYLMRNLKRLDGTPSFQEGDEYRKYYVQVWMDKPCISLD
jgi:hypothetical protein